METLSRQAGTGGDRRQYLQEVSEGGRDADVQWLQTTGAPRRDEEDVRGRGA